MVTKKRKMEKTDHKTYGQIKQVKTKTLRDKATLLKCYGAEATIQILLEYLRDPSRETTT
jgi:hypothetical protein